MKVKLIALINALLLVNFIWCQQDMESYKKNYGLYSNPYNFPNYGKKSHFKTRTQTYKYETIDTSTGSPGYSVDVLSVEQLPMGMRIPLVAIKNSSIHGVLIQDLFVHVEYETSERIHVKVK